MVDAYMMASVSILVLFSGLGNGQPNKPHPCGGPGEPACTVIQNLHELDCKTSQFAFEYGTARVKSSPQSLHDALNLWNCTRWLTPQQKLANDAVLAFAGRTDARTAAASAASAVYVSPSGTDTATGTESSPLRTLEAAVALAAKLHVDAVVLRAGKYYLNTTLELTAAHSGLRITAYKSEHVVVSGGVPLQQVVWSKYQGSILKAKVSLPSVLSEQERAHYSSPHGKQTNKNASHDWGPPPAKWNTFFVNGVRQVRARFPNANPQDNSGICFSSTNRPGEGCDGWLKAEGAYGGSLPGSDSVGKISLGPNRGNSPTLGCPECSGSYGTFKYEIFDPPDGHPVYNKPMPGIGWKNNSLFSFWADPLSRPAGVKSSNLTKTYKDIAGAVVHMFHGSLWGGWQYQVAGVARDFPDGSTALSFGYGGYQEARGAGIKSNHFYLENVLEELDAPGEWYFSPKDSTLYFWPNTTTASGIFGSTQQELVAPLLDTLISVKGAKDVSIEGIHFTETRATYLEQYEVPSGGDWSIHRGAAVFIEDSSNVTVLGCTFNQTGGNALMLSNDVTDSAILENEFVHTGDSAIAAVGTSDRIFATAPTYPNRIMIRSNHIHEVGVYGKQTSCYFQALASNVSLIDNLCYNGPRAGLNYNDGHGGNNHIEGNLVFNMVRETGDHGDRQPYLTMNGVDDGWKPADKLGSSGSMIKKWDQIAKNFWINGYNGVWTVDHDDGSQFMNDTHNFMVWGGCKNFLGNSKHCQHNVIVHPGAGMSRSGAPCQTDDNLVFANQYHRHNHCIVQGGNESVLYKGCCGAKPDKCDAASLSTHFYRTANNTVYTNGVPGASMAPLFKQGECTKGWESWQAAGMDEGSTLKPIPSADEIVTMGKTVLGV